MSSISSKRSKPKKRQLNLRQKKFIAEYLLCGKAAEAYRRAGYNPASAEFDGPRLLRNDQVRAAIEAAIGELNPVTVLKGLLAIGTLDAGDAFDEHDNVLTVRQMPLAMRRSLTKLKVTRERKRGQADDGEYERTSTEDVEISFETRTPALGLLGKHFKLFTDKVQIEAGESFAELVAGSFEGEEKDGHGKASQ